MDGDSVRTGESADYRYWAFISYSHADKRLGDWLHRALETYRVPKRLVGKNGIFGPVPRRLYPIFRDREELSASSSLGANIQRALQQSRSLIVICSPRAAGSRWVNEEVKYFKSLNREDRVLALIAAGEPNAAEAKNGASPEEECFPEALRFRMDASGVLTPERTEPIAGDARKGKDGKLNAKLKLLAGLIAVDYAALKQREQERRRRYLIGLVTLASTVALVMTGLAIFAFGAEREAQRQAKAANTARDQADGLINYMLGDLRDKLKPSGRLKILGDVADRAKAYLDGLPSEQMTSGRLRQRAVMLTNLGDVLKDKGELPQALDAYQQSLSIKKSLAEKAPSDFSLQGDLAAGYILLGEALRAKGDSQAALDAYRQGLAFCQHLLEQDPSNTEWRSNLANGYQGIGYVQESGGNLKAALEAFQTSLDIRRALAEQDKTNAEWQRNLSASYNRVADVLYEKGQFPESLDGYEEGLRIIKHLVEHDKSNIPWQNDLSVSYEEVGDLLKDQGKLADALESYQLCLNIRRSLVDQDNSNTFWKRNLSISYTNLGDVFKLESKLPEALSAYRQAQAIAQQLVDEDGSNGSWQDDLSWACNKVGDVFLLQGNLAEAAAVYQQGLAINKRLVEQDPKSTVYQNDLSTSYEKIGDVALRQGHAAEAQGSYQLCLKLRQGLVELDNSDTTFRDGLSAIHAKIGDALKAQGKLDAAVEEYQQSLDQRRTLADQYKFNAGAKRDLIAVLCKLATGKARIQGDDNELKARALLQEAASLAVDYNGSDRQTLIDSINQASQGLGK
ncbi:MAG: TIR domain-containing protein [Chthoniobacterales bacterium]